jgi:hypothetical protein
MNKYSHNKEITKTWDIMQHDVSTVWPLSSYTYVSTDPQNVDLAVFWLVGYVVVAEMQWMCVKGLLCFDWWGMWLQKCSECVCKVCCCRTCLWFI